MRLFSKRTYRWPEGARKEVKPCWLLGKCRTALPDTSLHTGQKGSHRKKPQTATAGEGVARRKPSCTGGGNADWYGHSGERCGNIKVARFSRGPFCLPLSLSALSHALEIGTLADTSASADVTHTEQTSLSSKLYCYFAELCY